MRQLLASLLIISLLASCSLQKSAVGEQQASLTLEEQAAIADEQIAELLDQYRPRYKEVMGEKVADVSRPIAFGKPESPLGNLVADALRYRAARETRKFVNLALIGESSFRLNLDEGELTRGEILEFMPYDNSLVLLKLRGESVYSLSQEIAGRGGVPVSGLRFRLEGKTARDVLVNSDIIEPEKHYWLATSSWIANGGEDFKALREHLDRIELPISIREVYLDYFSNQRTINPEIDGRIR